MFMLFEYINDMIDNNNNYYYYNYQFITLF